MAPSGPPHDRPTLEIHAEYRGQFLADEPSSSPRTDEDSRQDRPPDDRTTTHYFEDPVHVQRLFSPERVELLQYVMAEPPESIRGLARRLGRNPGDVNRDVHALAEYDVLTLEEDDQAKRPVVPYDRVRVDVVLTKPGERPDSSRE